MAGNSFGKLFNVTTFGESHGVGIGVVIDGCPAGLLIDFAALQAFLDKRKPGQSEMSTQRKETDTLTCLSGIFENKTTGAPITFFIANNEYRSQDYETLKSVFRPSHADFTYEYKYGHRDYRGGGRSSARETAARVAAGGLALQLLAHFGISITAYVSAVGVFSIDKNPIELDFSLIEATPVRCPDLVIASKIEQEILRLKSEGDSVGGIITCLIKGVPIGLGEPVFDRLEADLAKSMMSINATKGFDIGGGFAMAAGNGSQWNDTFEMKDGTIQPSTNNSGGVQGGISNGAPIWFRVAFKPVASIQKEQKTVNSMGEPVALSVKGRHDPCVVPRAVPIVEAMAALVIADHFLRSKSAKV